MKKQLLNLTLTMFAIIGLNSYVNAQAPGWEWAKSMGGIDDDEGRNIVTDAVGNIYTAGIFKGTADFDPGPGTFNLTAAGKYDMFITKFDASGNFIWAKGIGGAGTYNWAESFSMVLDDSANIYITGDFNVIVDFDPSPGTYNLNSGPWSTNFICKYDSAGNIKWGRTMAGTNGWVEGSAITIDAVGFVYTSGWFGGDVDFDPGIATFWVYNGGMYICKLDNSGNFIWAKQIGTGTNDLECPSIAIDNAANIYYTGFFDGTCDFDPDTVGTFNLTASGTSDDIFICKTDSAGNFIWAKRIGSTKEDRSRSIAIDSWSNLYIIGDFELTVDFDPGPATSNLVSAGFEDVFILKLDSSGNYKWAERRGDTGGQHGYSIISDPYGNTFAVSGPYVNLLKLDSSGNSIWPQIDIGAYESPIFLTTNVFGDTYMLGSFNGDSIVFSSSILTNSDTSGGTSDFFVAKLSVCNTFLTLNPVQCGGSYTSPSGNYTWNTSGIYTDIIPNSLGCDSIITINLTINPAPIALYSMYPDTVVPHNWYALNQCSGNALTYTWDWGDGSPVSNGATPSHIYSNPGNYNICVTVTDINGCSASYCDSSTYLYKNSGNLIINIQVVTSLPTGIETIDGNTSMDISPNPATNNIQITFDKPFNQNTAIQIFDIAGRIVYSTETNKNERNVIIDVSNLMQGTYFVKVNSSVRKIIKM